ncbi:uncharacterized protein LOC133688293 [Populus nigra]|uniref:uncharacterized protein LOC133688293 n=1 Tax=Populus nigra TaxID=3691 RepID=UPI002B275823|nr:uncharacterized protein LOC133688293 [Populus nigra]
MRFQKLSCASEERILGNAYTFIKVPKLTVRWTISKGTIRPLLVHRRSNDVFAAVQPAIHCVAKRCPEKVFLWGRLYLCFSTSEDKTSVKVEAKVLQTEEIIEINGDLLVAADGCIQVAVPGEEFLTFQEMGIQNLWASKERTQILENANFDLNTGSHTGLYELLNKRLNWIWYVHQPEPGQKVIVCSYPIL